VRLELFYLNTSLNFSAGFGSILSYNVSWTSILEFSCCSMRTQTDDVEKLGREGVQNRYKRWIETKFKVIMLTVELGQFSKSDALSHGNRAGSKPHFALLHVKGKTVPLEVWTGPWGSGSLRIWIFMTFRHYEGGRSSALRTVRLYPQEYPDAHF
jgi:hypothetical protein